MPTPEVGVENMDDNANTAAKKEAPKAQKGGKAVSTACGFCGMENVGCGYKMQQEGVKRLCEHS